MRRISLLVCTALLSACSLGSLQNGDTQSSSSSSLPETSNVSYTGTLEELGPSIYMQGTHQLTLEDGKIVLLESTLLTLDDYVGAEVVVFGAVRPTVEEGGIIMRVEAITVLSGTSSSSSESTSMSSSMTSATATTSRSSAAITSAQQTTISRSSSTTMTSSAATGVSGTVNATAAAMAKDDLAPARWSQQYCTTHIGFCVPVHKNWWYTSFGTSGSALWHVEVSGKEITGLGEGIIIVNLMSGPASADGSVETRGDFVVAQKNWKDNTHFEISAPVALKAAVTYMSSNITPYEAAQ